MVTHNRHSRRFDWLLIFEAQQGFQGILYLICLNKETKGSFSLLRFWLRLFSIS